MQLVVKKWFAETKPNDNGEYVHIYARRTGLISWLLSLLRLDPTVYFGVYLDQVQFRISSLSGFVMETAPISSIASCFYGYSKPWKQTLAIVVIAIWLASMIAGDSIIGALAILLLGMIIAVVYYALTRALSFGVTLNSGESYAMTVKRSVIENKEIDQKSFERVVAIISSVIRADKRNESK